MQDFLQKRILLKIFQCDAALPDDAGLCGSHSPAEIGVVVGTAGNNGNTSAVPLPHLILDLFRGHAASVAGLGIGIAGFDAVQTGLDQTVNIGCPVHGTGREPHRLVDQIGMGHDHDAAAAGSPAQDPAFRAGSDRKVCF